MIIAFSACTPKQKSSEKSADMQQADPKDWTDAQVDAWFNKGEWLNGWQVKPDESIDKRKMAESYYKFKSRWDMAFKFLKDNDLTTLTGTHNIDSTNVYVIAVDYNSKDKSDTRYESHKRYVDIQYVAVGEEMMGKTTMDSAEVAVPYSEANDIAYYKFDGGNYYKATPKNFFIFFPGELHRPSIKVGESVPIKRIVVKVLVE
jgi:biofilm protein TabA